MNEAITQLEKLMDLIHRTDNGRVSAKEWDKTMDECKSLVKKYREVPVSGKAGIDVVT